MLRSSLIVRRLAGTLLALVLLVGCSSGGARHDASSAPVASSTGSGTSTPPTSAPPTSPSPGTTPATSTAPPALQPRRDQVTPHGEWWAVDSTVPIDRSSLGNVRSYYRGHPTPVAWGRYLLGSFGLQPGELDVARRHGIAVYLLVPDDNCSGCGGDTCGNDVTAGQARADADRAVRAARRLNIPAGAALFKDVEEVSSCHGELTAAYLLAWRRVVARSAYRPAFYGNSTAQDYDFPRAYCQAVRSDPTLRGVLLAQDEPEPAIGAGRGAIGPGNAPRFAPARPRCAPPGAVRIWQYGESVSDDNVTDVDEIVPGTPGLLLPGGGVS